MGVVDRSKTGIAGSMGVVDRPKTGSLHPWNERRHSRNVKQRQWNDSQHPIQGSLRANLPPERRSDVNRAHVQPRVPLGDDAIRYMEEAVADAERGFRSRPENGAECEL